MKSLMANNHKQMIIESAKDKKMFEWGSGGTTIDLLKAGIDLTSVEHSQRWYDQLIRYGKSQRLDMSKQSYRPREKMGHYSEEDPVDLTRYIRAIGDVTQYDIILIDGLARGACLSRVLYLCVKADHHPIIYIHDTHRNWYDWVLFDLAIRELIPHDSSYPANMTRIIL